MDFGDLKERRICRDSGRLHSTLLQTVKTALARGETVLTTELIDEWRDDENQIEEAVTFLRQQAARGTILRIFLASNTSRFTLRKLTFTTASLEWAIGYTSSNLVTSSTARKDELEKLFRCDWERIHIHARDI